MYNRKELLAQHGDMPGIWTAKQETMRARMPIQAK